MDEARHRLSFAVMRAVAAENFRPSIHGAVLPLLLLLPPLVDCRHWFQISMNGLIVGRLAFPYKLRRSGHTRTLPSLEKHSLFYLDYLPCLLFTFNLACKVLRNHELHPGVFRVQYSSLINLDVEIYASFMMPSCTMRVGIRTSNCLSGPHGRWEYPVSRWRALRVWSALCLLLQTHPSNEFIPVLRAGSHVFVRREIFGSGGRELILSESLWPSPHASPLSLCGGPSPGTSEHELWACDSLWLLACSLRPLAWA